MISIPIEEIEPLIASKTNAELAAHFGVSEDELDVFMRRNKIKNPNERTRKEINAVMLQVDRYGVTIASKKLELSEDVIREIVTKEKARRSRIRAGYTPEKIAGLRALTWIKAKESGYFKLADDMASHAVVLAFEGTTPYINPSLAIKDYLNTEFGDKRSPTGKTKRSALQRYESLIWGTEDGDRDDYDDGTGREKFPAPETGSELARWNAIADMMEFEEERERVIFFMTYYLGLTEREIGVFFGLKGSCSSRYLRRVVKRAMNTGLDRRLKEEIANQRAFSSLGDKFR